MRYFTRILVSVWYSPKTVKHCRIPPPNRCLFRPSVRPLPFVQSVPLSKEGGGGKGHSSRCAHNTLPHNIHMHTGVRSHCITYTADVTVGRQERPKNHGDQTDPKTLGGVGVCCSASSLVARHDTLAREMGRTKGENIGSIRTSVS